MKKIILIVIFALAVFNSYAQAPLDLTKKPEPLEVPKFVFPENSQFTLSNGLKVFVVEDHEQPTVSMNLLIPGGASMDGKKSGLAELCAAMLTKGAGKLEAKDIANIIDGLGASLSGKTGRDYITVSADFLKKHTTEVVDIFSEILTQPKFDEDELEKLQKIKLSEITEEKSNPNSLISYLGAKAIYGDEHPYSQHPNEKSIKSIKIKDVKEYYKKYFVPNNSSLVIVGDVNADEIQKMMEIKLFQWKSGEIPKIEIPAPKPKPLGVYFVERPGSVQSSIMLNAPAVSSPA